MACRRRCQHWGIPILVGLILGGCAHRDPAPGLVRDLGLSAAPSVAMALDNGAAGDPFSQSHKEPADPSRVARLQNSENLPPPPRTSGSSPASNPVISKTSFQNPLPIPDSASMFLVQICAWVNGKPILMGDLLNESASDLYKLQGVPEPAMSVRRTEILKQKLQYLIDQEVVYQEAMRKLEKNTPFMDQLKKAADKQFEKRFRTMLERSGLAEPELKRQLELQKTSLETIKRQTYRDFIVGTYMQSRIVPVMDNVGHQEIRDYFQSHANEFQTLDRVDWEDIFIAAGTSRCPTVTHARQLAENLIKRVKPGESLAQLLEFDDGDSRLRKGKGFGQRKGEIRPPELEQYLFNMRPGDIGPIVELSTGVHVFRLVERDYAGQLPFNEEVQDRIRKKLKNDLSERETRRIIRELTSRAVIEVNRDSLK